MPAFLKTFHFWEFIAVLATAIFAGKQLWDTRAQLAELARITALQKTQVEHTSNAVSQELTISLDDRLSTAKNTAILTALREGLNVNAMFVSDDLDNYLAVYENLDDAYNAGLISDHNLCNMFADGLVTANNSRALAKYVSANQLYFSGYKHISGVADTLCL